MKYKKQILTLHKILGLTTGIVVFIVAITGCFWAFKEEIEAFLNDDTVIEVRAQEHLTPTEAKDIAKTVFPQQTVHGTLFKQPNDPIEVIFYDAEPEFYQSVFLNPYSGEILEVKDHMTGFFAFLLKGHMRLWLPKELGEQVVGVSILLFIIIIISGFLLWLPKRRKNLKQRVSFKWKATTRWKRKNFDLHTILGFYVCALALILAFTGSIMSYNWMRYGFYKAIGGDKTIAFIIPENTSTTLEKNQDVSPIDQLIPLLRKENPNAESFELHYPHSKTESIYIETSNTEGVYYDSDFRFFDQNTLEEIETPSVYGTYSNAKVSDKILRMNYDIHIGAIGGIAGKIIAFLSSLLIASLPVTGTLLWYGRTYKKSKKSAL